jgi:hypothetical protein
MIVINHRPSERQLRQFCWMALTVSCAVGGWLYYTGGSLILIGLVWGLGALVGIGGLVSLRLARVVYLAAMKVTLPIGIAVSWVNLVVIYYGVLTLTALVLRVLGRDALAVKRDPRQQSYWRPRGDRSKPHRYFQQF